MSTMTPTAPHEAQIGAGATSLDAGAVALEPQIAELQAGGISLAETLSIALGSLAANKLRTLLTALGVIIGVGAVVALMAIGRGSQQTITARITANGANLLTVRPGAANQPGGVGGQVGSSQTLTTEDAKALADPNNVPDASLVSPEYNGNGQLVAGSQNTNARITGAAPAYLAVHNLTLAEGDFIAEQDEDSMANCDSRMHLRRHDRRAAACRAYRDSRSTGSLRLMRPGLAANSVGAGSPAARDADRAAGGHAAVDSRKPAWRV